MLTLNVTTELSQKPEAILCFDSSNYEKYISKFDSNKLLQKLQEDSKANTSFNRFYHDNNMIAVCYVNEKEFEKINRVVNHFNKEKPRLTPDDISQKISTFDRFEEYKSHNVQVLLPENVELAKQCAQILALRRYKYSLHTVKPKLAESTLTFVTSNDKLIDYINNELKAMIEGIFWARDLSNMPTNLLYPETYKEQIIEKFKNIPNANVKVLDEKEILKEKMGALYAVGKGSHKKPYVVVIEYLNSDDKNEQPIALAGKGVCFDSGGISLKPANKMWDMIHDMNGSAAVVGTMLTLSKMNVKRNVVGIVGLVENMPGGNAQKPGDIVTSRSGQTIQMLNSDAEGRMVLADCIDYVQDQYKPKEMIDLATLTGAVIIALGHEYTGLWSNNFKFASRFIDTSHKTLDKYWQMPLHDNFDKGINSKVADVANINISPVGANSCTAAHFIGRFVKNNTPWIHLDIAGTSFGRSDSASINGFGIESMTKYIIVK